MTLTECIAKRGWESDKEITDILDRMQLRIRRRIPDGVFRLTKLQQTAIDTPGFWRDWNSDEPQNLMVQGATSAGKTLLAELAVIDTLAHDRRQAIILVPLKSMVHERKKQFSDDMPHPFRVYAASSDYMENDERLLQGDYDVAIIVYEKFFAMLGQENPQIMNNCGLLVVDELAMLSKDQRGPKLELALEMVRRNHSNTRIMCLATSDCSSEKVCRWLNIDEEHHIFSAARPVALEEHLLLLNGQGRYRTIPSDCEELSADSNPELHEEHLTIPGYQSDWKVNEKKKQLLQVVLQKLYDRKADFRVLIFVSSQTEASSIASYLRNSISTLFPPISHQNQSQEYESFLRNLGNCEEDEGQLNLIQNLIPHGIAYHHAGLSVTLRELIEEQFQQQASFLKVIVATETLTIGVNMPFDAMIMLSNRVPRGEGAPIRLTQQEYRNYIGRAGRLGQCNSTGITYVFLEEQQDMSYYWKSFNNREEIESALVSAEESYLAPYYLSLLKDNGDDRFTLGQIQALFQDSLTHVCNENRTINAQRLYSVLYNAYLADKDQGGAKGTGRGAIGGGRSVEEVYSIDDFGTLMAPYAFSEQTCIDIFEKFYDGKNYNGLPQTTTSEDIESDRYLLDILYHVCRHAEIERSSVLSYPKNNNNPSRRSEAKKRLITQLRRILEQKDKNGNPCYELWEESENNDLHQLMNSINLRNESRIAEAAMRAVLLFYWTQGKPIREIKKITDFSSFTKVTSGDIERIAEIASFHLDAIYKCIASAWYEVDGLVNSFYILQSRVRYGMTWSLVRLANKHVHGLDRNRLLRLEIAARERGMEPVNYLYYASRTELEHYITRTQLNSLMEALERRSEVTKFDNLIELVAKDAGSTLTDHQKTAIRQVYAFDGPSAQSLYESIRDTVNNNDLLPNIRLSTDGSSNRLLWWSGRYGDMMIGVLTDIQDQNQLNSLNTFFRNARERGVPCLLLMVRERNAEQPNEGSCEAWKAQMQKTSLQLECPTVFDNQFFAMILANAILKGIVEDDPLTAFLEDARGTFSIDEYKYFSVENYTGDVPAIDKVDLLLINTFPICRTIQCRQTGLSPSGDVRACASASARFRPWA